MGAGLIPVAEFDETIFYLFGQECYDKKWGDFGGRPTKNESVFDNAIREGYEELNGFLGTKTELKNLVKNNFIKKLDSENNKYHSYLFRIPFDPFLPTYFNNNHKFIEKNFSQKIDKNGFFEKSQIKWFTIYELNKEKSKFRTFYKDIVQQIIDNSSNIHRIIKIKK